MTRRRVPSGDTAGPLPGVRAEGVSREPPLSSTHKRNENKVSQTTLHLDLDRLTRDQVATLLMVAPKTVSDWLRRDDPIPVHREGGHHQFYVWAEVLRWRLVLEGERAQSRGPAGAAALVAGPAETKDELQAAKLEGENLRNQRLALDLAKRQGELLEVTDVKLTWSTAMTTIKNQVLGIGHLAGLQLQDSVPYAKTKRVVDALACQALESAAANMETGSQGEDEPAPSEPAATMKRGRSRKVRDESR